VRGLPPADEYLPSSIKDTLNSSPPSAGAAPFLSPALALAPAYLFMNLLVIERK